ncbi:uncharacterized protein LOC125237770 [Leguminivora glycinivorella]|uniref:uncharacterized protein LOC125237770 n=2 Tax=Leguminivora glycinivorella TaxID=1035111 RepID=UPI00200C45A3|nr:uncharacterized protein LOC125232555 isoform X2 [Leguminivora glycinivorella]XP_048000904.1 uncharacterized protein LOC125237770 [Leguminivora glycinivorella]
MNPLDFLEDNYPMLWDVTHPKSKNRRSRQKAKEDFIQAYSMRYGISYSFKDVRKFIRSVQQRRRRSLKQMKQLPKVVSATEENATCNTLRTTEIEVFLPSIDEFNRGLTTEPETMPACIPMTIIPDQVCQELNQELFIDPSQELSEQLVTATEPQGEDSINIDDFLEIELGILGTDSNTNWPIQDLSTFQQM